MSRAIQIRVAEHETRLVHVEDGVQAPLELLPILARERMAELLWTELAAIGFERDGAIATRIEADGIVIAVDLEAATITISLGTSRILEESAERVSTVAEEREASSRDALRVAAKQDVEAQLAAQTEALRMHVTAQLERKLGDLRAELDTAIGRATVAALTERAGELGQIESVVGDEAGNVTIRVKL